MPFVLLLLSSTCSAIASILLRLAGQKNSYGEWLIFGLAAHPLLYRLAAIGAYGTGFAFYALALKRMELSVAYPLMVAVTILEILLFGFATGESMSVRTILGALLLFASVLLLYMPGASTA
jgi:small multidrug resistance pump